MTRPSKLFAGKMYVTTTIIHDAMVEFWAEDEGHHPDRDKVPSMKNFVIEKNTPVMFLKQETKVFRNRNWGWTSPMPTERKRFFMFLVKEKIVCLDKSKLRYLHKLVYRRKG